MSDDQPRSGSRWEPPAPTRPLAADSPATPAPGGSADPPAGAVAPDAAPAGTPPPSDDDVRPFWRRRPRLAARGRSVRPKVAAGVAAVALAAGLGGFVLGSAVAGDDLREVGFRDGGPGSHGGDRDGDGRAGPAAPEGVPGGVPGRGGLGQVPAPPPGTLDSAPDGTTPEDQPDTPPDSDGGDDGDGTADSSTT